MGALPNVVRTADLLGELSLAADLGVGLPAEHAARSCYIGVQIATELRLSAEEYADLYYAELLMDAGCTAFTSQLAAFILGEELSARRDLFFFLHRRRQSTVGHGLAGALHGGGSTVPRSSLALGRLHAARQRHDARRVPQHL